MNHNVRSLRLASLALLAVLPVAGCHRDAGRTGAAQSMPPAAPVARGQVDIERGSMSLGMPVDGTIAEVAVTEGASVKRGQRLLATDDTPARLEEQLAQARFAQALAQVRLLQPKMAAATMRATRLAQAAQDGAGDRQDADDAREAAEEARAEYAGAQAGVALARAERERARYQVRQQVLRAPVDGDVLRMAAWPGMRTAQGVPLLTLLPASAHIVRAELSLDALSAVAPGDAAEVVSDDGRQTPLARARVSRIGRTFGQSSLQADPLQKVNERSVECVLALEPADALRVGQRVLVRFTRQTQSAETTKGR
jgi:multidrug resistance efflux pump